MHRSGLFGRSADNTTEREVLRQAALVASLGAAIPPRAQLRTGEVILDLGWGDRCADLGRQPGRDPRDARAGSAQPGRRRCHQRRAPDHHHRGHPDGAADVIISNGVVNLGADKATVFAEAFRVPRPGGRGLLRHRPDRALRPTTGRDHGAADRLYGWCHARGSVPCRTVDDRHAGRRH